MHGRDNGPNRVLWGFRFDFRASHLLDRTWTFNFSGKWIIVLPERFIILSSLWCEWVTGESKNQNDLHTVAVWHRDTAIYVICMGFFSSSACSFVQKKIGSGIPLGFQCALAVAAVCDRDSSTHRWQMTQQKLLASAERMKCEHHSHHNSFRRSWWWISLIRTKTLIALPPMHHEFIMGSQAIPQYSISSVRWRIFFSAFTALNRFLFSSKLRKIHSSFFIKFRAHYTKSKPLALRVEIYMVRFVRHVISDLKVN